MNKSEFVIATSAILGIALITYGIVQMLITPISYLWVLSIPRDQFIPFITGIIMQEAPLIITGALFIKLRKTLCALVVLITSEK